MSSPKTFALICPVASSSVMEPNCFSPSWMYLSVMLAMTLALMIVFSGRRGEVTWASRSASMICWAALMEPIRSLNATFLLNCWRDSWAID